MSSTWPNDRTRAAEERLLERHLAAARNGEQNTAAILDSAAKLVAAYKNGNGTSWVMKAIIVSLLSLIVSGVIGGVNLYGRVIALEKTCQKLP